MADIKQRVYDIVHAYRTIIDMKKNGVEDRLPPPADDVHDDKEDLYDTRLTCILAYVFDALRNDIAELDSMDEEYALLRLADDAITGDDDTTSKSPLLVQLMLRGVLMEDSAMRRRVLHRKLANRVSKILEEANLENIPSFYAQYDDATLPIYYGDENVRDALARLTPTDIIDLANVAKVFLRERLVATLPMVDKGTASLPELLSYWLCDVDNYEAFVNAELQQEIDIDDDYLQGIRFYLTEEVDLKPEDLTFAALATTAYVDENMARKYDPEYTWQGAPEVNDDLDLWWSQRLPIFCKVRLLRSRQRMQLGDKYPKAIDHYVRSSGHVADKRDTLTDYQNMIDDYLMETSNNDGDDDDEMDISIVRKRPAETEQEIDVVTLSKKRARLI